MLPKNMIFSFMTVVPQSSSCLANWSGPRRTVDVYLMATDMNTSSSTENAVVVEIPRSPRNAVHSIGVGRTGRRREQEDTGDLNDNEEKDRLLGDTCSGGVLETRRGTTLKNI